MYKRQLEYLSKSAEQNSQVAVRLSVKEKETKDAVQRLLDEVYNLKGELAAEKQKHFEQIAASCVGKENVLLIEGDMEPVEVRKCTDAILDKDTDEVKGTYEVTITASSFDGDDNCFAYSATAIRQIGETDSENQSTSSESEEASTDSTSENGDSTDADSSTDSTDATDSTDSTEGISQDDALSQAKDYYGEDAEYSYKKQVTVGDKEYYDFSVSGDNVSSTDVLVSVDGQDVIGGTQNDDGSWSFDQ